MEATIKNHLLELAEREGIKILMAVESGSRAWGCPSPDSDYDVRIIYKHPYDSYLSIEQPKESIDYFHGALLDINGWDIKKTLRLVRKSNATPFEWAQSPMVYSEDGNFRKTLLELCHQFFQPYHSLNHYKGIAKNSYFSNELKGAIKLKKLFYVLRPLMAATWIIKKESIPPMDIPNLLPILNDPILVETINNLLAIKYGANEDYVHPIDPIIADYIAKAFAFIDEVVLVDKKPAADVELLNTTFRSLIKSFS